jgi:hypothetical protein
MPARPKTRRESAKKAAATKAGKAAESGIKAAQGVFAKVLGKADPGK